MCVWNVLLKMGRFTVLLDIMKVNPSQQVARGVERSCTYEKAMKS